MEKRMVSLTFLILLLFVSFVLAGDPQTASSPQTSQALNNELAECEANLSLLQQQLQELNQTLENVTRERDYYKTLYENVTVNVTNIELIKIKQNITILNQQIQQLNMSLVNIERKIYDIKVWSVELAFGSIVGVTLLNSLVYYAFEKRRDKPSQEKEEKEKGEERKNGFKGARHPESHS